MPKFPSKIITDDKAKLSIDCQPYAKHEFADALIFGKHLLEICKEHDGAGLSAPQLGVYRRIAVVNVRQPLIMINLWISWRSLSEIEFKEGCLSFPGQEVITMRNKFVKATWVNEELKSETRQFGPVFGDSPHGDLKKILECVAVQHEENHLSGKLFFDFAKPILKKKDKSEAS